MAIEYRKFNLTPGQQPPSKNSTGKCLLDGSIIWVGEEGLWVWNSLANSIMTAGEIDEYNKLLEYEQEIQPEEIIFEIYIDPVKLAAEKTRLINIINNITLSIEV